MPMPAASASLAPVALRAVDRLIERHTRAAGATRPTAADIKPPILIDDPGTYAALTNQVDNQSSDFRTSSLVA